MDYSDRPRYPALVQPLEEPSARYPLWAGPSRNQGFSKDYSCCRCLLSRSSEAWSSLLHRPDPHDQWHWDELRESLVPEQVLYHHTTTSRE